MRPVKLSVIVLTHNDENKIVDCLEKLSFSDEIIVVDDNSTDRTVELARQFTNSIHVHPLNQNFSNQRNYSLNFAHGEWVLFIDSDEIVSENLAKEIRATISDKNLSAYYLRRIDYMWGHRMQYGEGGSIKLLRLAKKGIGKWHGKVHEVWKVRQPTGILENELIHHPHPTVRDFVQEIDMYSSLRSEEIERKQKAHSIIFYPLAKFLVNYIWKRGYKDGNAGLIYAMCMSLHSFLVRSKSYLSHHD